MSTYKEQDAENLLAHLREGIDPDSVSALLDDTRVDCEGTGEGESVRGAASLDQRITDLFLRMGVPPHLKGYQYLKEAVKLTAQDRMIIYSITKELYPKIAQTYGVTTTKVELAIRHTVEVMYDRDRMRHLQEVLGFPPSVNKQKPTNGELIALIADKILSGNDE